MHTLNFVKARRLVTTFKANHAGFEVQGGDTGRSHQGEAASAHDNKICIAQACILHMLVGQHGM